MAVGGMGMICTANYEVRQAVLRRAGLPWDEQGCAADAAADRRDTRTHAHSQRNGLCLPPLSLLQARKFGVRSAMPGFIAKRLCPQVGGWMGGGGGGGVCVNA
jgi:nucleotidyltransferase/DNA polymerase involved in DNA repair